MVYDEAPLALVIPEYSPTRSDGSDIYHRNLHTALLELGLDPVIVEVPKTQSWNRVPRWKWTLTVPQIEDIRALKERGYKVIVSHEKIFDKEICPDVLVIHNYFPRFQMRSFPLIQLYYRMWSKRFFGSVLPRSRSLVFLSFKDLSQADNDFNLKNNDNFCLSYLPVPPQLFDVDENFDYELIHLSGSKGWFPKRMSAITDSERLDLARSFKLGDFTEFKRSGFTLIDEKFDVGFKLKLMQAMYFGDFIFSRVDLLEEVKSINPNYDFYRNIRLINEIPEIVMDLKVNAKIDHKKRIDVRRQIGSCFNWHEHTRILLNFIHSK